MDLFARFKRIKKHIQIPFKKVYMFGQCMLSKYAFDTIEKPVDCLTPQTLIDK